MTNPEHCKWCSGKGCVFCPAEPPTKIKRVLLATYTYDEIVHPKVIEAGKGFMDAESMREMVDRHGGKTESYWREWEEKMPVFKGRLDKALAEIRTEKNDNPI